MRKLYSLTMIIIAALFISHCSKKEEGEVTTEEINGKKVKIIDYHFYPKRYIMIGQFKDDTLLTVGKNEILFKAKERIGVHISSNMQMGILKKKSTLKVGSSSIPFKSKTMISFDEKGQIIEGIIDGCIDLPAGTNTVKFCENPQAKDRMYMPNISFNNEGKILGGFLGEDTQLRMGPYELLFTSQAQEEGKPMLKMIFFNTVGEVVRGYLGKDTLITVNTHSILFARGSFFILGEDDKFEHVEGILAKESTMFLAGKNVTFKKGSLLNFSMNYETKKLFLSQAGVLEPTSFTINNNTFACASNSYIYFYGSGGISTLSLNKDTTLRVGAQNVLLKGGNEYSVSLDEKGNISAGILTKPTKILAGATPYIFNDSLTFHPNGSVNGASLERDTEIPVGINRIRFKGKKYMFFYPSGGVNNGFMAADTEIKVKNGTAVFKGDAVKINFYKNGNVKEGMLINFSLFKIGGHEIPFYLGIKFHENGGIDIARLYMEKTVKVGRNKLPLNQGNYVYFYPSGALKTGFMARDVELKVGEKTKHFPKSSRIDLDENGNIKDQ
ncbi:hypothetical protein ACFL6D_00390 [Spirochaetota bacterium]